MANKALARRQKMVYRVEPSQKGVRGLKPRNPFAVPAGQRSSGAHRKGTGAQRQQWKRAVRKDQDRGD